jgi:pimeloyl-ACP methyl ester carboxylesterase
MMETLIFLATGIKELKMSKVTSKDGTQIAYDKKGSGPALILVDGALCYRSFGPMTKLSELLVPHFSVITYDRRGRGESTNSKPYSIEREVEDIDALIKTAGGSAYVFGTSSGACLAMEATVKLGNKVKMLAMYEPPYNSIESARRNFEEYQNQLNNTLAAGNRGAAIGLFMQLVGTPAAQVEGMKQAPVWPMFEAVAPTLAYDAAVMGRDGSIPIERAAKVTVPTLVMDGGASLEFMPFMRETAISLAKTIPNAQHRVLEGQRHDVNVEVLAPVLVEFFNS